MNFYSFKQLRNSGYVHTQETGRIFDLLKTRSLVPSRPRRFRMWRHLSSLSGKFADRVWFQASHCNSDSANRLLPGYEAGKLVRLVAPFTRNRLNRTKILTPSRSSLLVRGLFCVVGRLGRKRKIERGAHHPPRAFYFSIIAIFIEISSGSLCGREWPFKNLNAKIEVKLLAGTVVNLLNHDRPMFWTAKAWLYGLLINAW